MPSMDFDPLVPVEIHLDFNSPQAVSYALFQKQGGGNYSLFASGTDEDGVEVSGHQHLLAPVPSGTTVKYRLIFGGNQGSPIKAQVSFSQNGVVPVGGTYSETGVCDQDGVAVRSKEITFNG